MIKLYKILVLLTALLIVGKSKSQSLIKGKDLAHENGINSLCIGADGNVLLSAGNDGKSYLWNAKSLEKLKGALKHNEKVLQAVLSANQKYYATYCADKKVRILDIEAGSPIKIISDFTADQVAIFFHPFSHLLYTIGKDKIVKTWDQSRSKTAVNTFALGEVPVACTISPDGKNLLYADGNGKTMLVNAADGSLLQTISTGKTFITLLAFSNDANKYALGTEDGKICIADASSGKISRELNAIKGKLFALAWSWDGSILAMGGSDKKVIAYNINKDKTELEIKAHEQDVKGIVFAPNGQVLYTASTDGSIKSWEVTGLHAGQAVYPDAKEKTTLIAGDISLQDENNNGLLDAGEKASIEMKISNTGITAAYAVTVNTRVEGLEGLIAEKEVFAGNLETGKSTIVRIPLSIGADLASGTASFTFSVREGKGAEAGASVSYQAAATNSYSYIMVSGYSFYSATGKGEIGAPVTVKVKLKNIAKTDAKNVRINFIIPEKVKAVNRISENIALMKPGEEKEVSMDFFVEREYALKEVKILVDIEGVAFTNAKDILMKLKLNESLPMPQDYTGEVIASAQQIETENQQTGTLYRGSVDPLKGLNVSKPKEMIIGDYYALIIGIDKYQSPWTPLNNAVNDATALEKLLQSGYKFNRIKTLYNTAATRENIINEFEWLIGNVKPNDNVLIFYSGHGEYKKELSKGYWVPSDANSNSTSKYISNSDIQTYVNGIKSKHTLLVTDACFSGDIFRGNIVSVPFEESEKYFREVNGLPSRQALTSGGVEPVMDGGKEGHSVFSYYLLKTLKENNGKYFDANQLYNKVRVPVINNSEQTPKLSPIKNAGDEGGQFIFIKK